MATFDDNRRVVRKFKPLHALPGEPHRDFILLPYGYMCNREYTEAMSGDTLIFHNGEQRTIRNVSVIKMDAFCDCLCWMRYGVSLKRVLQQWQSNASLLGAGKKSISTDECLIVFYDNSDKIALKAL